MLKKFLILALLIGIAAPASAFANEIFPLEVPLDSHDPHNTWCLKKGNNVDTAANMFCIHFPLLDVINQINENLLSIFSLQADVDTLNATQIAHESKYNGLYNYVAQDTVKLATNTVSISDLQQNDTEIYTVLKDHEIRIDSLEDDNGDVSISTWIGVDCTPLNGGNVATCNDINLLYDRANNLTAMHYIGTETPAVVEPPELILLPNVPLIGPNPELVLAAPITFYTNPYDPDKIQMQYYNVNIMDIPRGEQPIEYIWAMSTDGTNWTNSTVLTAGKTYYGINSYQEYFFTLAIVNNYGVSPWSPISSGISSDLSKREMGWTENLEIVPTGIKLTWVGASWLFGADLINTELQRSVDYGEFEVLVNMGTTTTSGFYTDTEVVNGTTYSYRVQTTTTSETQPRSGFTSIIYNP